MARDHALAEGVEEGCAWLRLYRWERPTISFGRNEPATALYDEARIRSGGVDAVRRPTGGRAVLHHRELTYAVAFPSRALGGARSSYRRIHRAIARGLVSLGVPAEMQRDADRPAPGPDSGACFATPVNGEVTARGRKMVGSAQRRLGAAILQHGSILLEDDQASLERLRRTNDVPGEEEGRAKVATISEFVASVPAWPDIEGAVVEGFRGEFGGGWKRAPEGCVAGESRLARRYGSAAWTWRR